MIDAVLFDWRGTLFTDETEEDWVRNAASSIGRHLEDDEITAILERAQRYFVSDQGSMPRSNDATRRQTRTGRQR